MRRVAAIAVCGLGAWLAVAPAKAGAPADLFESRYEGKAERDPQTFVGFDVVKRDGERKVAKVKALLPYACDNGDGARVYTWMRGKLAVGADGRFAGKLRDGTVYTRGGEYRIRQRFAGRLRRAGRARGTVDSVLRFSGAMRGAPQTVRCYSGELRWRARRGADADPPARAITDAEAGR